jgi:hypothetical protein
MNLKPMTAPDIAERLGITVDTFYRKRHALHQIDKMPRPICETGRPRYERAGMEAWLTRHHPQRPQTAPANDVAPAPDPASDQEHRARLRAAYAPQNGIATLDNVRRRARG